jgi:two-component system chemotaxis response regulator CheB
MKSTDAFSKRRVFAMERACVFRFPTAGAGMSFAASNHLPARVLIVDDSAFMRTALSRMVASESEFEVVGTACSGAEALEKLPSLNPDIVTLDLKMPGMDGLETLRRIMFQFPRPVIVVSASSDEDAESSATALALGASAYVPKRMSANSLEIAHIREDLIAKLRAARQSPDLAAASGQSRKPPQPTPPAYSQQSLSACEVVAIGASTGGPQALQKILSRLPKDFSAPVLVVQHMPPGFTHSFAERLNQLCSVTVRVAVHGETIQPGVVYLAPAGLDMTVQRLSLAIVSICLSPQPSELLHIPSVDLMMKSAAQVFGKHALGVILTGMGSDGAEGVRAIHLQGGITIGQDAESCVVYGMPRACAEKGLLTRILPLSEIPAEILLATHYRRQKIS